jgi:capsid assembly protease
MIKHQPPLINNMSTEITTALRIASTLAWAITPTYLSIIEDIVAGRTDAHAVATELGRPLENTRTVENRNGVAVIPVNSVIFRYASLFRSISGNSASVDTIAKDFYAALNDPQIKAIVFKFDTPGGEVAGISQLANIIYKARGVKPIKAYVDDLMASAGFWLGAGCDEIISDKMGKIGSVGVVAMADISKNPNKKSFTSKNAGNKNVSADTGKGESLIQAMIDTAEDCFIADLALTRDVTTEKVISDFGQGWILYADEAKKAGMIDRIGSFEDLIAELQQDGSYTASSNAVDTKTVSAFKGVAAGLFNNKIKVGTIKL